MFDFQNIWPALLIPSVVVMVISSIPALAFCWVCNRFITILDRKWQREAEKDAVRAEAERLNRPFVNR